MHRGLQPPEAVSLRAGERRAPGGVAADRCHGGAEGDVQDQLPPEDLIENVGAFPLQSAAASCSTAQHSASYE